MISTRSFPRMRQYKKMIEPVEFIRVGKIDELRESGWIKVRLLGYEIAILGNKKEFIAIELNSLQRNSLKSFLPEDFPFSKSGVKKIVEKFISGPHGQSWGTLKYFPVRVEGDSIYVGVSMIRKDL